MQHTKYQGFRPNGVRQEYCFYYISLVCRTCDPWGGAIFCPRDIILANFVEVYYLMLHTKYQGSWPSGFRQAEFLCFFSLYTPL